MTSYVLIADFDADQASSYAEILREEGWKPVIAKDGAAAAAILTERGAPDLLLTDLSLPEIDGFELIRRLRRLADGDRTMVVVVSASRELRDRATGRRAALGISAVLARAATGDSIRRVLTRLLTTGEAALPALGSPAPRPSNDTSPVVSAPRDSGVVLRTRALPTAARRARS